MAQQNDKFNQPKDSQKQQPNIGGKTAQPSSNNKDMSSSSSPSRQSSDFSKDKTQTNK